MAGQLCRRLVNGCHGKGTPLGSQSRACHALAGTASQPIACTQHAVLQLLPPASSPSSRLHMHVVGALQLAPPHGLEGAQRTVAHSTRVLPTKTSRPLAFMFVSRSGSPSSEGLLLARLARSTSCAAGSSGKCSLRAGWVGGRQVDSQAKRASKLAGSTSCAAGSSGKCSLRRWRMATIAAGTASCGRRPLACPQGGPNQAVERRLLQAMNTTRPDEAGPTNCSNQATNRWKEGEQNPLGSGVHCLALGHRVGRLADARPRLPRQVAALCGRGRGRGDGECVEELRVS